jgi:hypothetical protein
MAREEVAPGVRWLVIVVNVLVGLLLLISLIGAIVSDEASIGAVVTIGVILFYPTLNLVYVLADGQPILPPDTYRETLKFAKTYFATSESGDAEIEDDLLRMLKQQRTTRLAIMENDWTAEECFYHAAKSCIERKLDSGIYHVQPGVLSSTGDALLLRYNNCVAQLIKLRPHKEVEYVHDADWLNEQIAKRG